jgi:C-terminal processing protease CtpA/Prc
VLPALRVRDDLDYADAPYPTREHRLLAGIRLWAVLDNFSPYRYLAPDWDDALRAALPRLAIAADTDAYRTELRLMSARFEDGHVGFDLAAGLSFKPRGSPAFEVRLVEHKIAVVRLLDGAAAGKQGLAVGDVIETIDDRPAAAVMAERRPLVTASTDEARDQFAATRAINGDDGSVVRFGVRGADGKLRNVSLTRSAANLGVPDVDPSAPHWKKLAGNVGYVDLRTLVIPEVNPMLEDLKGTRAIVFDMRGYPHGTVWPIAPRVNTRKAVWGALFLRPLVHGDDSDGDQRDQRVRFLHPLPLRPKDAWIYTGKIVVLIDDRAISHAEHSCLFLSEAAGATFVGSPTHGANGDITVMRLPGGLRMSFTGQEVRHVDGKQLQKVGILPDIVARPTLAGLRAGKDEVLDRALAFVANGK